MSRESNKNERYDALLDSVESLCAEMRSYMQQVDETIKAITENKQSSDSACETQQPCETETSVPSPEISEPKYDNLQIDEVCAHSDRQGFTISWSSPDIGFGEFALWIDSDGCIQYDAECMDNAFVSKLLSLLPASMKREG